MNKKLFLTFIIFTCQFSLDAQVLDKLDTIDILKWKADRLLTFDDFHGRQGATILAISGLTKSAVVTDFIIKFKYNDDHKFQVIVTSIFYRNKSWILCRSAALLNHEQGHFDITEIFARRLRAEIKQLLDNGIDDRVTFQQLRNKYLIEEEEFQENYDSEAGHGIYPIGQEQWDKKIKTELQKYSEWMQ